MPAVTRFGCVRERTAYAGCFGGNIFDEALASGICSISSLFFTTVSTSDGTGVEILFRKRFDDDCADDNLAYPEDFVDLEGSGRKLVV